MKFLVAKCQLWIVVDACFLVPCIGVLNLVGVAASMETVSDKCYVQVLVGTLSKNYTLGRTMRCELSVRPLVNIANLVVVTITLELCMNSQ
jgi:hypothetical protein